MHPLLALSRKLLSLPLFFTSPSTRLASLPQHNMAAAAALAVLRAAAGVCQLAAPSFSDEQAAQSLAIADELRARFLPPRRAPRGAWCGFRGRK